MPKVQMRASVAQLVAGHRERLEAFLRARLANPDDAAELAQEAYLRMLRVRRADLIRHPQAYLYRIARNLAHELQTARRINYDPDADVDQLESPDPSPYDLAVLAERRKMIEQVMEEMAPKCQTALLLRWREGLTQAEIATRMNLSRQMVQKYLATGLALCRKRLRRIAAEERRLS